MANYEKRKINLTKGPRSVYEKSGEYACYGCFKKKLEVERLRAENRKLKEQVRRLETSSSAKITGAHIPSSQIVFKGKTKGSATKKNGGAQIGHPGKGRQSITKESADRVIFVSAPRQCKGCGKELGSHSNRQRSVLDATEMRVEKVHYTLERGRCPRCKKLQESPRPLFKGALYGNSLLSQVAVLHYLQGIPIGRVCDMLGKQVNPGSIFSAMHRIAKLWEPALHELIAEYRKAPVKHADETSWRIDGQPGWSWLFCSSSVSIFDCQNSRSSRVPRRIFGEERLPGVLVVDRFIAYNKLPCQLQYCYAHLLRETKKLEEEFPESEEVLQFSNELSHFLSEAMRLQGRGLTDEAYYKEASQIAGQIKALVSCTSKHLGIQSVQNIFSKQEARFFQWALNRAVPAHNNRAERELRQTVIARKVSFGSQSEIGAKTRSTLMSVLATAKKRLPHSAVENWFKSSLDQLALNPDTNPHSLFPTLPP